MRGRAVAVTLTGVVVAAGVLVAGYTVSTLPAASSGDPAGIPATTAEVVTGTVTQRFRISGTYGFDGSWTVTHRGADGILTAAAAPGSEIARGDVLYRVDGAAVRLLYGNVPAYRTLSVAVTDGDDVRQLERNLKALGMDPFGEMTVDRDFTAATAAAVRRLQKKWGVTRTGRLEFGAVAFLAGEVRVATAEIAVGGAVRPDRTVLTGTTTRQVVTADLTADRQNQIEVGDEVSVTLPGSKAVNGEVLRVGRVATAGTDGDGNATTATVRVVMRIDTPADGFDQATVRVDLATAEHEDVLVIPVSALLAAPGAGEYRVRLADGSYAGVEPGLYDDTTGLVEVTGGVRAGDRVEVPEQ